MAVEESRRFRTMSKYANFASSSLTSGEGTGIILMPFLPGENWRHGPERWMANGRQLAWRMRYRNTHGAEKDFPRIRPSWIDSLPIYSPPFDGIPIMMFAPSCGRSCIGAGQTTSIARGGRLRGSNEMQTGFLPGFRAQSI